MSASNEVIIRIQEGGSVVVEECKDGVHSFKPISPDSLLSCINASLLRGKVTSGVLPRGCLSYTALDNGGKEVCILHPEDKADISYYDSQYTDFPLPKLVFGFHISNEGRISECRLGVVGNERNLKPTTPLFTWPFTNVSKETRICIGNNPLPRIQNLHTMSSLTYHILSLPHNDDYFSHENNTLKMGMRDLLEYMKDKPQEHYYSHILRPSQRTLEDFICGRS